MVDIKLDEDYQLTKATNGDLPLTLYNNECIVQDIKLESITQEGDLFYDEGYGWSLLEFIQSEYSELIVIEIQGRVRDKLIKRKNIDSENITVNVIFENNLLKICIIFKFIDSEKNHNITIELNRVNMEVVVL